MKIFAHRGASQDAPENTREAFALAWKQHADGAELDVRLSRDGRIVVCHDANTLRTTGSSREISETNSSQLRDLPSLVEVIGNLPPRKQLLVEVKCGAEIVPVLEKEFLPPRQIGFLSFDAQVLAAVKAHMPENRCLLNVKAPQSRYRGADLAELCMDHLFSGVSLEWHEALSSCECIHRLHATGLVVATWTVDEPDIAISARNAGIDILMTNRPALIREALRG